jgi:hypothetical protein
VGVYVTGWLVDRTGTFVAPFYLTAGIAVAGAVFYLVFGSGQPQNVETPAKRMSTAQT